MEFACWLLRARPVSPETVRKYVSTIQAWHGRRFGVRLAGGLTLARLPAMLKGMVVSEGGKRPRRLRVGVRPAVLAKALRGCFQTGSATEANWEATMVVGFCGLLRGKEMGRGDRASSDFTRDLTRADVRFMRRGGRKYAVLWMHPCDKGVIGEQGKRVKLVLGGGGVTSTRCAHSSASSWWTRCHARNGQLRRCFARRTGVRRRRRACGQLCVA